MTNYLYHQGYMLKDVRIVHDKVSSYVDCISDAYMHLNVVIMFDRYLKGQMKPNYPVPAIPIEIEFFDWAIVVAEMNNPEYKYGLITLYPHN